MHYQEYWAHFIDSLPTVVAKMLKILIEAKKIGNEKKIILLL